MNTHETSVPVGGPSRDTAPASPRVGALSEHEVHGGTSVSDGPFVLDGGAEAFVAGDLDGQRFDGQRVVLVGADCRLGSAIYERLVTLGAIIDVAATPNDWNPLQGSLATLRELGATASGYPRAFGPQHREFANRCASADVVLIVGSGGQTEIDGSGIGSVDVELVDLVLQQCDPERCRWVGVVSTAMVYGASGSNPIPMSESAPIPHDLPSVVRERLDREIRVERWGRDNSIPIAILRPCLLGSSSARNWMDRSVFGARRVLPHERAPIQYLHIQDLVDAIVHVGVHRSSGIFNVAPNGWLDEELLAALADVRLSVRLGPAALKRYWKMLSVLGPGRVHADIRPYSIEPWVVSSSRLQSTGWRPSHSNEEAFLISHRVGWWSAQTARRRQDVALAGASVASFAALGGLVAVLRHAVAAKTSGDIQDR